jgi:hypothetical protein
MGVLWENEISDYAIFKSTYINLPFTKTLFGLLANNDRLAYQPQRKLCVISKALADCLLWLHRATRVQGGL